jgi:bifunctional non-homologous end joining protein LigD
MALQPCACWRAPSKSISFFPRNGLDWTKRFSTIAGAFEVPGRPSSTARWSSPRRANFSEAELAGGRQSRLEYYAFDLLYLDGYDLRAAAQTERKRLLKELFDRYELELPVRYSEHLTGVPVVTL